MLLLCCSIMTVRTQIALTAESHRSARQKATEQGISLAEYIRRLVEADLNDTPHPAADVTQVFDMGDGGRTDISQDKERLVGEAVTSAYERSSE